ncbi:hypothetical protein [Kitasatospora purpeofusca]|uniref:hypothetical protein n=1 Tax=Kitasatospora purpeofusca TaxID=67352 RepID=UPI0036AEFF7F
MVNHDRPQSGMFDSGGTGHPPRETFRLAHRSCVRPSTPAPDEPVVSAGSDDESGDETGAVA